MKYLSLSELSALIKSTIHYTLNEDFWITAEIANINRHYNSGHCYLDLVEKQDDAVTARIRATIWASSFRLISSSFRAVTGLDLQAGMKILMLARVTYHEVHGLSLNIQDIDPRYTLGEMALKRRQTIERLTREGIIDRNRHLPLPEVMQKIAVISSQTAAGYGDFLSRLENNPYGYRFSCRLFQAYMQGEKAEESILNSLKKCITLQRLFDAVVIIRGGGSTVDLHCFDSYPLARLIALSPLPVFTGIGHERDETVADRVANIRLITPTAVAEFFISTAKHFEDSIDQLRHRLTTRTNRLVEREKHHLENLAARLAGDSMHYLKTAISALRGNIYMLQTRILSTLRTPSVKLKIYEERLRNAGEGLITDIQRRMSDFVKILNVHPGHLLTLQTHKLENYETKICLLDPVSILERGYSITYLNGKVLKDASGARKDDAIYTRLHNGTVTSIVAGIDENTKGEQKIE